MIRYHNSSRSIVRKIVGTSIHSISSPTLSNSKFFLSDLKQRLGKCILFGLNEEQTKEAGRIAKTLAQEWVEMMAGYEGFSVDPKSNEKIRWGDMVIPPRNCRGARYPETD